MRYTLNLKKVINVGSPGCRPFLKFVFEYGDNAPELIRNNPKYKTVVYNHYNDELERFYNKDKESLMRMCQTTEFIPFAVYNQNHELVTILHTKSYMFEGREWYIIHPSDMMDELGIDTDTHTYELL